MNSNPPSSPAPVSATEKTFPRIVAVTDVIDHGSCDGQGNGICPHCGAEGRYVYRFICEDGTTRGAMKGCLQLFPKSQISRACETAFSKQKAADAKKGYISRADAEIVATARAFAAGTKTLRDLERAVASARIAKDHYMRKMGWRR